MSAHIAPHRWADAWGGRVPAAERAEMDRHAETCRKCARARDRVTSASNSYSQIRAQQAPELPWDSIRARVHWSVSSEKRSGRHPKFVPARRRVVGWLALGAGALAAASLLVVPRLTSQETAAPAQHAAAIPVTPAPVAAPLVGLVSRVSGEVMIDGVRQPHIFDQRIRPGMRLATADGHIDVQFGDASAFSLGPRSVLQLRRFDASTVELAIDGTVDVEVAPRAAGQRFLVIAGDQTIEVRGTQFRVTHDGGETHVACHHGLVAVRDARGALEVPTARKVVVQHDIAGSKVEQLSKDELVQLALATPHTVPLHWTDVESLAKNSSALDISSDTHQDVRVDGIEVGAAPVRVRVVPGRHTVEALDGAGRYHRVGWVDVTSDAPAGVEVMAPEPQPAPVRNTGVAVRKQQLHAGIDRARLRQCTRRLAKSDFSTHIVIDMSVDDTGAVTALNIIETELSLGTQSCLKDVLQDVTFPRGPAATWQERIEL